MSVRRSPAPIPAALGGINTLNYSERYVGAATLPLIHAALSLSDAAGGAPQG